MTTSGGSSNQSPSCDRYYPTTSTSPEAAAARAAADRPVLGPATASRVIQPLLRCNGPRPPRRPDPLLDLNCPEGLPVRSSLDQPPLATATASLPARLRNCEPVNTPESRVGAAAVLLFDDDATRALCRYANRARRPPCQLRVAGYASRGLSTTWTAMAPTWSLCGTCRTPTPNSSDASPTARQTVFNSPNFHRRAHRMRGEQAPPVPCGRGGVLSCPRDLAAPRRWSRRPIRDPNASGRSGPRARERLPNR